MEHIQIEGEEYHECECRLPTIQNLGNTFFVLPGRIFRRFKFSNENYLGKVFCRSCDRAFEVDLGSIMNYIGFIANVVVEKKESKMIIYTKNAEYAVLVDELARAINDYKK